MARAALLAPFRRVTLERKGARCCLGARSTAWPLRIAAKRAGRSARRGCLPSRPWSARAGPQGVRDPHANGRNRSAADAPTPAAPSGQREAGAQFHDHHAQPTPSSSTHFFPFRLSGFMAARRYGCVLAWP